MFSRVRSEAKIETADPVEMKLVANDGTMVSRIDRDSDNVIRRALEDAQAAGKSHMSQNVLAIQAVQRVRPNMTTFDALVAVNLIRREYL